MQVLSLLWPMAFAYVALATPLSMSISARFATNTSAPFPMNITMPCPRNTSTPFPMNMTAPFPMNMTAPFPIGTTCLGDFEATYIVDQFASLLIAPQSPSFVTTASALLADNFTDTSDSINILAGVPLGATTFSSKQAFIGGQAQQPPIPSLQTLDIFHDCSKIAWRWVGTGIGSKVDEVKGINTFTISPAGQIEAVNSEFNSGAWLADIGNPQCQTS